MHVGGDIGIMTVSANIIVSRVVMVRFEFVARFTNQLVTGNMLSVT